MSPRWVTTFGTGQASETRGKVSPAQVRHEAAPVKEPCSNKQASSLIFPPASSGGLAEPRVPAAGDAPVGAAGLNLHI